MFKYLILFPIILFNLHVTAQDTVNGKDGFATFSGSIADKSNQSILSKATVSIQNARDSSIVAKGMTDDAGKFMISHIPFGQYYIRVSSIGYTSYISELYSVDKQHAEINANRIYLQQSKDIMLSEMTIVGKKPLIELKNDRLVFNVEQSISVSGGDAIDVLKKTPGIKVTDNTIGLTGKNTVKVMINNRVIQLSGDDLISFLKTIQGDQLTKVEVITNPPSMYDVEGSSGIVNIITKKNKDMGISGLLSSSLTKATYYSGSVGGDLNYSGKKLIVHLGVRSAKSKYAGVSNEKTFYSDQVWDNLIEYPYGSKNLSVNSDIDYQVNKNTSIGLSYNNSFSKSYQNPNSSTHIYNTADYALDSLIKTQDSRNSNPKTQALNIRFQSKLDTAGKKINVDLDFFGYDKTQSQLYFSDTYSPDNLVVNGSSLKSLAPQKIKIYSGKTELVLPSKIAEFTVGAKISFIKNESSASYYNILNNVEIYDNGKSNAFEYSENTQAVFVSANKELKKWSFQLGLRAEATQTTGLSSTYSQYNTNNYIKLFPSAFISDKIDDNHTLGLSYTKRIERPGYARLNPFKSYSNPYSYAEGNPFLQPSFNDNFEINHQYKGWLISKFYFSIQKNGFEQITAPDQNTKSTVITQNNFLKTHSYGLNEIATFNLFSWLESINEADLYYKKSVSSDPRTRKVMDGMGAFVSTDNTATLNKAKTLSVNFSFWYQFPEVNNLADFDAYYSFDLGLRAKLFKKLSVNVVAQDIFKTMKQKYSFNTLNILQNVTNYSDNRRIRLSISYKFGGKAVKKSTSGSNTEETQRF